MTAKPISQMPDAESSNPAIPGYAHLQEAAEWFVILRSGEAGTKDQQGWHAWLARSATNRAAWQHLENISQRFAPLQQPDQQDAAFKSLKTARQIPVSRRRALASIASLVGLGALGWSAWRYSPLPDALMSWRANYNTGTGEVRAAILTDGTQIWLNSASAVNVDYTQTTRNLHLITGEILIKTAADARPFSVTTTQGQLRPLGTEFSVRQQSNATDIAVYNGAVNITTRASGTSQILHAGQQTRFSEMEIDSLIPAETNRRSWSSGLLMAEDMPLATLIDELGIHHRGFINLAPELAQLRVMGTYPLTDINKTLAMLETTLPLTIERRFSWWINIAPR